MVCSHFFVVIWLCDFRQNVVTLISFHCHWSVAILGLLRVGCLAVPGLLLGVIPGLCLGALLGSLLGLMLGCFVGSLDCRDSRAVAWSIAGDSIAMS